MKSNLDNAVEATKNKNNCCAKGEGAVDLSTATRCFKKLRSKNQVRLSWPKTVDSETVLQTIE